MGAKDVKQQNNTLSLVGKSKQASDSIKRYKQSQQAPYMHVC